MKFKKFLLLVPLLLFQLQTRCQSNLSLDETLTYINNKLKETPIPIYDNHYSVSCNKENGKIIIDEVDTFAFKTSTTVYQSKYDFFPKDITVIYEEEKGDYSIWSKIIIKCKKQTRCINKQSISTGNEKWENKGYSDSLFIGINNSYMAKSIVNALNHLITLINNDGNITQREIESDPFAPLREGNTQAGSNYSANTIKTGIDKNVITMKKMIDGTYEVPVVINDVLKISFIFDSGASDVSVSPDVAMTLTKTGTVKQSDFIGSQKYQFADGSVAESEVFIIRELKIGNKSISNIRASISNSIDAPMLLGQSVLQKFGKFTIDNANHTITLE